MTNKLYAFWRNDVYPYVLGGPVTKMDEEGRVQTRNYGPGHWFTPIKLLPHKSATKLLEELAKLREEYLQALSVLNADYRGRVTQLMPELKKYV